MNNFDMMRQRLLFAAGVHEPSRIPLTKWQDKIAYLEKVQWSPWFEKAMRHRMIMGGLRYGTMPEQKKKMVHYDIVEPIARNVAMYEKTGNVEYLVDAANYCMLTAETDNHPTKHFQPTDDTTDHCRERRANSTR